MRNILCVAAILMAATSAPGMSKCAVDGALGEREAAERLIFAYSRAFDERRFSDYADLFTSDAEWWGGKGVVRGRAAIGQTVTKAFATLPAGHDFHTNSNIEVSRAGDGVTAFSRWVFWTKAAGGKPEAMAAGHYEDELKRVGGCWLFAKRVIVSDIPFSDPRNPGQ